MEKKEVKLKVMEALREEAYRGIVRIDSQTMHDIEVRPGDIVEIEGGRKTVGIIDRAYPTDVGQSVIRMDGLLRRNAKTGLGEYIKIRKVDIKEAKSVTIAPAQKYVEIQVSDTQMFKRSLLGRAIVKGDQVALGGTRNRRTTMMGGNFEDIFDLFERGMDIGFPFGGLQFVVVNTDPKQAVIIAEETNLIISPKRPDILEEKIVEVTYEDIGGLNDEIKKIREMVELPLKHPEVFERLGIQPPKGVLLHGSPGTGKTLLAKAVANETSANFIHIDGPSVMCVDGDTEILTNPDGRRTIAEIFEDAEKNGELIVEDKFKKVIHPKNEIKVFAMDDKFNITTDKVKSILRLEANETYKISTKKKGNFKTSKNQPFATLDNNGKVIWKKSEDLKAGDYVAIAGEITPNQNNPKINWFDKINKKEFYTEINGKDICLTSIDNVENLTNLKYTKLSKNIRSAKKIKPIFNITADFTEFIGAIYSDGWISNDHVGIAEEKQGIRNIYKRLFNTLFDVGFERIEEIKTKGGSKVVVYSTALANYLNQGFEVIKGRKSLNVKLPGWIFKCNKECIASFLRGYYHGDGSQGWKGNNYPNPVFYSKNQEFLKDIQILLLNLGIVSKIVYHKNEYGDMWKVVILDTEGRERFYDFVIKDFKKDVFDKWLNNRVRKGSSERLPALSSLLHDLKRKLRVKYNRNINEEASERYISGRDKLTFRKGRYILEKFKLRISELGALCARFEKVLNYDLKSCKQELKDLIDKMNIMEGEFADKSDFNFMKEYVKGKGRLTEERRNRALRILQPFFNSIEFKQLSYGLQNLENILSGTIKWDLISSVKRAGPATLYDFSMETYGNFLGGNPLTVLHNSKYVGEAEKKIRDLFAEAEKNSPSILFIDEIDAIAPKREESYSEVERRVVAQLLAVMDGLKSRGKVVVIGATNRPNALDPALRRPGRFDREIEIGVPKYEGRLQIFKIHTRDMPLAKDVKLDEIAKITHGFVGADLEALCKESAMIVLRRLLPDFRFKKDEPIEKEILEKLIINMSAFKEALKVVRPSALREVLVEVPNVRWDDIGGMEEIRQSLIEAVEWPLKNPQMFKNLGVRPPRGILLYGPPGTGKTLLAKAVATESETNFILVKAGELLSKWVGDSEKGVKKTFERARQVAPTVIFFDEIDALAPKRGLSSDNHVTERVVNQLLTEIDGLEELHDVVVIGATNRPDILDPALLRPGRFDRIILTPVPDEKARLKIFEIHTKRMPLENVNLKELVKKTENYVGADIEAVCREAAMHALRKNMDAKKITMEDFKEALKRIKNSITSADIKKYENIEDEYLRTARGAAIRNEVFTYTG